MTISSVTRGLETQASRNDLKRTFGSEASVFIVLAHDISVNFVLFIIPNKVLKGFLNSKVSSALISNIDAELTRAPSFLQ